LPVLSFFITSERRLHKQKGATEFTNCTSIISVVSICPNFSRQLFVFRKSLAEGRHRVLLRKTCATKALSNE
jgi:hypothetical protein